MAEFDDGSCITISFGCNDPNALIMISTNVNDGSCVDFEFGCIDSDAFDYNLRS